jgi:acetylglutamate synthase
MRQPWLHSGMRVKMEQIHELLMQLPPSSSVSITRPDELAKELFTHRGSGTLVRRGEKVLCFESWEGLDLASCRHWWSPASAASWLPTTSGRCSPTGCSSASTTAPR